MLSIVAGLSLFGGVLAAPNADAFDVLFSGQQSNAANAQKQMGSMFTDSFNGPPLGNGENWQDAMILGCVENQNYTMKVGDLSVVYAEGAVRALPNTEPIVWTLTTHENTEHPGWIITHRTPWGKEVHWNNEGWRIGTSPRQGERLNIKYTQGSTTSPQIVVAVDNGNCVNFRSDGVAHLDDNSYCQPISLQLVRPRVWQDASKKQGCASTHLRRLVKAAEDELKRNSNVHASGIGDTLCGYGNKALDSVGCALGFPRACEAAKLWRPEC